MIEISSRSNDHFKRFEDLATSKGIRKHGEFLFMGEKLVRESLKRPSKYRLKAEVITEGLTPVTTKDTTVFSLSKELFKEVDVLGTGFNLLVFEVPEIPAADLMKTPDGLELVCPLGDPSNMGAVLRSALAFGASKVILTEEAVLPFHPKAVKASAGAVLRLPLFKTGRLEDYRAIGHTVALEMQGLSLDDWRAPANVRLIVGEEGPGLPDLPVPRIAIPTMSVESLNATVAASIAMHTWRRQKTPR